MTVQSKEEEKDVHIHAAGSSTTELLFSAIKKVMWLSFWHMLNFFKFKV